MLANGQAGLETLLEERGAAEQTFLDTYMAAASRHQQELDDAANKAAEEHERLRER